LQAVRQSWALMFGPTLNRPKWELGLRYKVCLHDE
jgi:hypothetical protein